MRGGLWRAPHAMTRLSGTVPRSSVKRARSVPPHLLRQERRLAYMASWYGRCRVDGVHHPSSVPTSSLLAGHRASGHGPTPERGNGLCWPPNASARSRGARDRSGALSCMLCAPRVCCSTLLQAATGPPTAWLRQCMNIHAAGFLSARRNQLPGAGGRTACKRRADSSRMSQAASTGARWMSSRGLICPGVP